MKPEVFFIIVLILASFVIGTIAVTTHKVSELKERIEILELRLEWDVPEEEPLNPGMQEEVTGYSPR